MTLDICSVLNPVQHSQSMDDAWTQACDKLRSHARGEAISYIRFATSENGTVIRERPTVLAKGFDVAWERSYLEEGLHRVDPIHQYAMTAQRPFYWDELQLDDRAPAAIRPFLTQAREAGLSNGLSIPVFGPHLSNGCVSMTLAERGSRLTDEEMTVARSVSQALHIRFGEIELPTSSVTLSERERETLVWAARGKSTRDIAEILNVSAHTVDTLLRRVYRKLDVHDRTSAAIKALSAGFLHKS